VEIAALFREKILTELSAVFDVHPTVISTRKQKLVKRAAALFGRSSKAPAFEYTQKVIVDLHGKNGSDIGVSGSAAGTGESQWWSTSCRSSEIFLPGSLLYPKCESRAMITPNAGVSIVRSSMQEIDHLNRLDRIFPAHLCLRQSTAVEKAWT